MTNVFHNTRNKFDQDIRFCFFLFLALSLKLLQELPLASRPYNLAEQKYWKTQTRSSRLLGLVNLASVFRLMSSIINKFNKPKVLELVTCEISDETPLPSAQDSVICRKKDFTFRERTNVKTHSNGISKFS